jgi:hypothetical protein
VLKKTTKHFASKQFSIFYFLAKNGNRYIKAIAYNTSGNSSFSTITVNVQNLAATILSGAVISRSAVRLNWNAVAGATGYKIWRNGFVLAVGNLLEYVIGGLPNGTHNFKVSAYSKSKQSNYSNLVPLTLTTSGSSLVVNPPSKPTGFGTEDAGETTIGLVWIPSTNDINVLGYEIRMATDAAFTKNVEDIPISNSKQDSFTVIDLLPATTYYFKIRARDNANWSDYSLAANDTATTAMSALLSNEPHSSENY